MIKKSILTIALLASATNLTHASYNDDYHGLSNRSTPFFFTEPTDSKADKLWIAMLGGQERIDELYNNLKKHAVFMDHNLDFYTYVNNVRVPFNPK